MNRKSLLNIICLLACFFISNLDAAKSKYFNSEEEADSYLITHYNLGCQYYNNEDWHDAAEEFEKVVFFFPHSEEASDASFFLGASYFKMNELDFANESFSRYLKASYHPNFFEKAVQYKFCIAESFKCGKKKRPFTIRYLPKWISAYDLSLTIYDEVIAALPNHPLTIQALYSKAELLKKMRQYREAVETYQTIIRRFPKDEIVPICYLNISETYLDQSHCEFQNPDILALAELNLRKFKDDFPRDERINNVEQNVVNIKELYAKGLCDLGRFYERMKEIDAAIIYYQSCIEEFPDTHVAEFCHSRLICLGYEPENDTENVSELESPIAAVENEDNNLDKLTAYSLELQNENQTQTCIQKAPPPVSKFEADGVIECDKVPYEEYSHYSLRKKRQVSHAPYEPVECENHLSDCNLEGNLPSRDIDDPKLDEDAPYIMHYSQLKPRDQKHVTPRE